jgi:hypothetical protein
MIDLEYAWNKVRGIDNRITAYNSAKATVQAAKDSCTAQLQSWESSYNALANNAELSTVKKTDVFEGEMADVLGGRVSDIMGDISAGLAKARALELALDMQIIRIDVRVGQLQMERGPWAAYL